MWGLLFKVARAGALVVLPCAMSLAATASGPQPGKLETYKDWTIGCDNGGHCSAVSLIPEEADDNLPGSQILMIVERDAGPSGEITITAQLGDAKAKARNIDFMVDGTRLLSAPARNDEITVRGPQASALALAMARGNRLEVRQGARLLGSPSLRGAAAAFRYMDAQQGRAGTSTALVATGALGAQAVKAAPLLPLIKRLPIPTNAAPALWRDEQLRAVKFAGCQDEQRDDLDIEIYALGAERALLLIPCGAGAYNFSSVPLLAVGKPGRRTFAFAAFDYTPGWGGESDTPMLVNAGFDPKTGRLSSYAKGRGLGDCGSAEEYVWDGARFRLVQASAMGECRGAWTWITSWRARTTP